MSRDIVDVELRIRMALLLLLGLLHGCAHSAQNAAISAALSEISPTVWEPFSGWKLQRPEGPSIDVYVARREGRRPTILILPGSKCLPLFWVLPGRRISSLFLQGAVPRLVSEANFVAFDRRGLKSFGPPPKSEEEARSQAVCTTEHGGVSKTERVDDATAVASSLLGQPWVSELWILGHSEGADVASGVVKRLGSKVSVVGLFAGAGITRFFEQSVAARKVEGSAGALKVLEGLIVATGPNPPSELNGEPLIQAQSYGVDSTPLDDLRGLSVPIFIAHGDADEKVAIEAADAFVGEVLRRPVRPIRYVVFPGCDHGFFDAKGNDHSEEALRLFMEWARDPAKGRSVSTATVVQ